MSTRRALGSAINARARFDRLALVICSASVVFVPKTGIALTHKTYQQYLQQFVSPTIGASYQINN